MADISKITTLDGTTYNLKDDYLRHAHYGYYIPLDTKTYTNVIATENDNNGAGFFYLKVRPTTYNSYWHVKTRVIATVPGYANYYTDTIFDVFGFDNAVSWYTCLNRIKSTSYRPIYYNSVFFTNSTGYNNDCGHWIGINLTSSTNNTNASYKRTIEVQLLECIDCTAELQDNLITPTNIPNRANHTNWYTSTNTSYSNYDACNYGLKQTGDANTTTINNLVRGSGNYVTDSALYRYQMLFQKDENTLTPLNNVNNSTGTTKAMLTDVEFNAFGWIYYYNTTTIVDAAASIGGGALAWAWYGIDLRYTFNCGTTLTAHQPFYLVVTPTSNGYCKIASSSPWSQTLPNSNDGKWYILIGRTYSTYQLALYPDHPVYYHDGTMVREVLPQTALVTSTTAGLMSSSDKIALDGKITAPASANQGQILSYNGNAWQSDDLYEMLRTESAQLYTIYEDNGVYRIDESATNIINTFLSCRKCFFVLMDGYSVLVFEPQYVDQATGEIITICAPDTYSYYKITFTPDTDTGNMIGTWQAIDTGEDKITEPQSHSDGDILVYDASNTKWIATAPPSALSDFTNDVGYMTGMTILSYGSSTWQDFINAYNSNKVVYCRASSNSNPASGSQTRLAFMAYVNNATTPTEVEFQYYRSVNAHSASQQGDQMYVYKLKSTGGWSVTVRESYTKIVTGTGLTSTYADSAITLNVTPELPAVASADDGKVLRVVNGAWAAAQLSSATGVSF